MTPHPATGLDQLLLAELSSLREAHRERALRPLPAAGKYVDHEGQRLLNLAGNDYFGLAQHLRLIDAACKATAELGTGATASRLVCGTLDLHTRAEREVAKLKHAEAALLLASGYTANLAVLTALAKPGDLICQDKLNHASLIDAARFSGAEVRSYPHKDLAKLERLLARHAEAAGGPYGAVDGGENFWDQIPAEAREAAGMGGADSAKPQAANGGGKRFIVTDSVFSMDGDCADLPALCDLADRYGAVLIVDEAHGTGVLGQTGGGLAEHQGVAERVYRCGMGGVVVSTASKALGGLGGLVTGSQVVIDYLVNKARPLIYSTAVPPAQAAAVAEAAAMIREDTELRPRLAELSERFAAGLGQQGWPIAPQDPRTPIFPLVVGTSEAALALAQRMRTDGVLGVAIRPPTVPPGTARVRVSLRADLSDDELTLALKAIGRAL